jgi:hypothetical protein
LRPDPFVPPTGPVFHDPIQQGAFKSDVTAGFLTLNPFVPQDFLPFG